MDPNYLWTNDANEINTSGQHLLTVNSTQGENGLAVLADNKGNVLLPEELWWYEYYK